VNSWFQRFRRRETVRAVLVVTTTVVGIVLPIDFLSQVDGYLMYLHPWELLPVWGVAWLFYGLFGLAVGTVATLAAEGAAILFRKNSSSLTICAGSWLSLSIIALALIRGAKLLMGSYHFSATAWWMSQNQRGIVAGTLFVCAAWAWGRHTEFKILQKLARLGSVVGLTVALVAPLTLVFTVSVPLTSPVSPDEGNGGSRLPDIVLITIDALAANHLSLYGYSRPTTPSLEKLAQEANVFDRFYANSNFTTPTVNSFINGVRPWTHRTNQNFARVEVAIADQGLIARLKRAGYETFAVSTNPFASPFQNRSNRWLDAAAYGQIHVSIEVIQSVLGANSPLCIPATELSVVATSCKVADHLLVSLGIWTATDHFDPELAFSVARHLVEKKYPVRPMFLWVHLFPPHNPYAAPSPFGGLFDSSPQYRTRFDSSPPWPFYTAGDKNSSSQYVGRYDEAIAYVDHHTGSFLDWLKQRRLYQNALIVISADHGESFSHGYSGHGGPMLHDDVIHVPLLIKEPGQTVGKRLNTLSEQIDLMPTILDLAGVPIKGHVEGRSLKPVLRGQNLDGPVFAMNFEQSNRFGPLDTGSVAMIEGRWKYIHYLGHIHYPMMLKLEDSLYDLQADPGEMTNLVATQSAIAARMRLAIEEQLRLHGGPLQ